MFRSEKSDKLHLWRIEQYIDGGAQITVHSARIGHKSYPLALERSKVFLNQHLDSGLHYRFLHRFRFCRKCTDAAECHQEIE